MRAKFDCASAINCPARSTGDGVCACTRPANANSPRTATRIVCRAKSSAGCDMTNLVLLDRQCPAERVFGVHSAHRVCPCLQLPYQSNDRTQFTIDELVAAMP